MTNSAFKYKGASSEVFFGFDAATKLAEVLQARSFVRPLLLTTSGSSGVVGVMANRITPLTDGAFRDAAMHTPVEVTERASALVDQMRADVVISLGGGSAIGLGKALRHRHAVAHIAIPTTYAGSEATAILGQTENGRKTTLRNDSLLPDVLIYDPVLTTSLPASIRANSAMNAIAHAIEGLYAQDRNPLSSLMAAEGIRAFVSALPAITANTNDMAAYGEAQYGAWLCGCVLNSVGMALHHKICHTLGGSFDLPHAEVHAIMLPYSLAYNAQAAAEELAPLHALFGENLALGLKAYAQKIGAAQSLAEVGMKAEAIMECVTIALTNPYWNPAPLTENRLRAMLEDAQTGAAPRPYNTIQ